MAIWCHQRTHSVLWSTSCCAVKSLYVKSPKCGLVQMTGMPHKRFFTLSKHSKQCNIKQNTADTWLYVHTDIKEKPQSKKAWLFFFLRAQVNQKTKWCKVRFDCIVPEKLRRWDECDWSVPPDSLLPFEYGPSSEETAGELWRCCYEALWWHAGKRCSRRPNEHDHPLHIMTAAHTLMLWTAPWVTWGLSALSRQPHPSELAEWWAWTQDPGRSLHFVSTTSP